MLCLRNVIHLGTLVFAILVIYSTASPTSLKTGRKIELSPARRDSNAFDPRRTTLRIPNPSHTTRDLQRRTWKIDYLDEGWALYFSTYEQYLRINNAAAVLEDFFMTIANKAAGPWHHETPLKEFTIYFGELALDFKCDVIAIPWGFVAMFAERMANSVQTGFTGAFEAILEHLVSGGMVYVKLRTTAGAAPAA